jgi:hypothetical protein
MECTEMLVNHIDRLESHESSTSSTKSSRVVKSLFVVLVHGGSCETGCR